jgi:hypothetical protein
VKYLFTQRPYAAIRAPRSRRDKDMSDNKAIKQTIRVFLVVEFSISPDETGKLPKKVTVTFQYENTLFPMRKTVICRVVDIL